MKIVRSATILAIELSSARGSLAWRSGEIAAVREWANDRKNSGAFFKNLAEVQREFGPPESIIVGLGPGSYAGVRIAISAAIGMQTASGAKLVGLPSICAIECDENEYFMIGDARRETFFFARVCESDVVQGPDLYSENELREKIDQLDSNMPVFASEKLPQFERVTVRYPSAGLLARLAQEPNQNFSSPPLEPIYLREPHITMPKK